MGFLEDKNGQLPSHERAKAICKLLCRGWVELMHWEVAPPFLMESTYPDFKLADSGWKLDYLASTTYPTWQKVSLDDNGQWKPKRGKGPEIEDNKDDDDSIDEVAMKQKSSTVKSEAGPQKHFKGEHIEGNNLTPSTLTTPLSPPSNASSTSFESPAMALPAMMCTSPIETAHDNEVLSPFSDPLCDHVELSNIKLSGLKLILVYSSAALALAASKAQDILLLPPLDPSQESLLSSNATLSKASPILELEDAILPTAMSMPPVLPPMVDDSTVASVNKSTKQFMCSSLAQASPIEQIDRKVPEAYDNEAMMLAMSNTWDVESICNGTLY
ncbi:hypothetical protein EDD16DRAFT_1527213 [Pisolithus croceorrhizus]|nr:hypothetical protein EDD16DRAFT_1527213 [Pisolithus croceorrhizus]